MTTTRRVLVVCTVHRETGHATAGELHWLLGRLHPDMIFLEHSAAEVAAFPDSLRGSLELAAVMRYREHTTVELVPVGLHIPDAAEFKPSVDSMIEKVEEANPQYYQWVVEHRLNTERGGHAFLNSPHSARLQSAMQRQLRIAVDALDDPALTDAYGRWTRLNHLREMAFLRGLEDYARNSGFDKAVLLVGAAHRQPLADNTRNRDDDGDYPVAWDFEWEFEET